MTEKSRNFKKEALVAKVNQAPQNTPTPSSDACDCTTVILVYLYNT